MAAVRRWRKLALIMVLGVAVASLLIFLSILKSNSDESVLVRTLPAEKSYKDDNSKEETMSQDKDSDTRGLAHDPADVENGAVVPVDSIGVISTDAVPGHLLEDMYPTGPTWTSGFCKEFIVDTFDKGSLVCPADRVMCRGTHHNKKIGMCTLTDVGVLPQELYSAIEKEKPEAILKSSSAWLLRENDAVNPCPSPDFNGIESFMEPGDYARSMTKMLTLVRPQTECKQHIPGTTYIYMGMEVHIYFKFLGWYNLHKAIITHSRYDNDHHILRVPEGKNTFLFPDFEKLMFPEVSPLKDLGSEAVCFDKVILVPWAYAATPFRCKMDGSSLSSRCLRCDGNGLYNDLHSFRSRVIKACRLEDKPVDRDKKNIVVVERKQYHRRLNDKPQTFQRVWTNSNSLIDSLRRELPKATVTGVHAEELSICEQISLAHSADVLIGMHGAGLVHLWWQQQHGVIIELVPSSQRGNAAFITLAKLLGHKHISFRSVTEVGHNTQVDVGKLVGEVKKLM